MLFLKKNRIKVISIISISVFGILAVFSAINIHNKTGKISCNKIIDGYEIVIYDKWDKIIKTDWSPVEPGIGETGGNIIEVVTSTGNPARYVYYFDKKSLKISKTFFNPVLITDADPTSGKAFDDNKYIAYMEDGKLIITDLFDEGLYYKEIIRDFSKTGNPGSAVIQIGLTGDGSFVIEYLKGEDYKEVRETIPMYD